jgi:hypothetical protein
MERICSSFSLKKVTRKSEKLAISGTAVRSVVKASEPARSSPTVGAEAAPRLADDGSQRPAGRASLHPRAQSADQGSGAHAGFKGI